MKDEAEIIVELVGREVAFHLMSKSMERRSKLLPFAKVGEGATEESYGVFSAKVEIPLTDANNLRRILDLHIPSAQSELAEGIDLFIRGLPYQKVTVHSVQGDLVSGPGCRVFWVERHGIHVGCALGYRPITQKLEMVIGTILSFSEAA